MEWIAQLLRNKTIILVRAFVTETARKALQPIMLSGGIKANVCRFLVTWQNLCIAVGVKCSFSIHCD